MDETRHSAIMFTDLVGYSRMMGENEHRAIESLNRYRASLVPEIEQRGGRVIEFAGDAVFACFESAVDAVDAGLAIQRALASHNAGNDGQPLHARVGIHVGDVVEKGGRPYGDTVNIAARLEPLCTPPAICISAAVRDTLDAQHLRYCIAYGRPRLKNIRKRMGVFQLFAQPVTAVRRLRLLLARAYLALREHPVVGAVTGMAAIAVVLVAMLPWLQGPPSEAHYVELATVENLSPDRVPPYYGIGMEDEIRTRLGSLTGLYVSRPDDEIGSPWLLRSSIQQMADQVRLGYRLLRRADGAQLGGGTVAGHINDMLSLQQRLADSIANDVAAILGLAGPAPLEHGTIKAEAYPFYLQGREYLTRPDTEETLRLALELFGKAIQRDRRFAAAYAGTCRAHWSLYLLNQGVDNIERAEEACKQAIEIDDTVSEVHVSLGEIYRIRGRWDDAIATFNEAIRIEPRDVTAFIGLANTYTDMQDERMAEQAYQRAIGLQAGNWEAWNNYGNYLFANGRYRDAVRAYRKVVDLTPDHANAYGNLGAALLLAGDISAATEAFEAQLALKPSLATISNAGGIYYYLGDYERAANLYRQALELAPEDCHNWANLADVLHQDDRQGAAAHAADRQAVSYCDAALAINPANASVLATKAKALARVGERQAALSGIGQALSLTSGDPQLLVRAALVYQDLDETEKMRTALEDAVAAGYPVVLIRSEPAFAALRTEPWFVMLVNGEAVHNN